MSVGFFVNYTGERVEQYLSLRRQRQMCVKDRRERERKRERERARERERERENERERERERDHTESEQQNSITTNFEREVDSWPKSFPKRGLQESSLSPPHPVLPPVPQPPMGTIS